MTHNPHPKPPLGVIPYHLWREACPCPSLPEYLERYCEVSAAVTRYRAAELSPLAEWLIELGTMPLTKLDLGRSAVVVKVEP